MSCEQSIDLNDIPLLSIQETRGEFPKLSDQHVFCYWLNSEWNFVDDDNPSKRRKTEMADRSSNHELLASKINKTYDKSQYSPSFLAKLVDARFWNTKTGKTICIYCSLMCHRWDEKTDNPIHVHRAISPGCPFTSKTVGPIHMTDDHEANQPLRPAHANFIDLAKRVHSFSDSSTTQSLSSEELAKAGFFLEGSTIICFYCNGSLATQAVQGHPLLQHMLRFPHCTFAGNVCGRTLRKKVERFMLGKMKPN